MLNHFHSALLSTRCYGSGDPVASSAGTQESTKDFLSAMTTGLPGYSKVTNDQILPNELAQLQGAQQVAPGYAALMTNLLSAYGPQLNQIGSDLNAQNAMGQAKSDLAIYQGPGKDIAREALETAKISDPEYYATRAKMAEMIPGLLSGKLTGGEEEAISRGVARDNSGAGVGSRQSIGQQASNAMLYGNASRDRMTQALSLATGALPTFKSGVDTGAQTVGRPTTGNQGAGMLPGQQQGQIGNQAQGVNNGLLNQVGGITQTAMGINANRRDTLDRFNQTAQAQSSAVGNVTGGGCCFIFLQSYNGRLPDYVRFFRDKFMTQDSRNGYVWMSNWLVPIMKYSPLAAKLVNTLIVTPISRYGASMMGLYSSGTKYKYVFAAWFKIWTTLGRMVS